MKQVTKRFVRHVIGCSLAAFIGAGYIPAFKDMSGIAMLYLCFGGGPFVLIYGYAVYFQGRQPRY